MAESNILLYETSTQDGQPVECYKFIHDGTSYNYTSSAEDIDMVFSDGGIQRKETYFADYIKRQAIKPASSGDSAGLTVTVSKDHPVAKLFQGPPPEKAVNLKIYRLHDQDKASFDVVFYGRVSQASFEDSECNLTCKLESWLSKEIPNMMRQYVCGNVLFRNKCRLKEEDWTVEAFVDHLEGLTIESSIFALYPDGYFTGGVLRYGESVRTIKQHTGKKVILKYPFVTAPRNNILVTPGCNHLFKTCAVKFGNTLNFSGCPYVPPTDPEKKTVGKGVYWVDNLVIQRDTKGNVGTIEM